MSELSIFLSEKPGAIKRDFLATTESLTTIFDQNDDHLPHEVVFDNYSRDTWARLSDKSNGWENMWLKSIDKKGRIPGLLSFLKSRKKAAFGNFISPQPDEVTGEDRKGLILVPYEQPPYPSKDVLMKENVSQVGDLIFVKYCLNASDILMPKGSMETKGKSNPVSNDVSNRQVRPINGAKKNKVLVANKSSGLLGSILGTQERTNRNLEAVPQQRKRKNSQVGIMENNNSRENQSQDFGTRVFATSNQVINNFRTKIEKKMQSFASSPSTETKIPISIAEEIKSLESTDEKLKVTMEILKYVVYEQVEEIGEDRWVADKEPSEFVDEAIIAVYKAGYAPQEVLEELNRGEMPDEAKQQQRAMREALNRVELKKVKMVEEENLKKATDQTKEVKRLNNVKRDRRSIEEIQRDMMCNNNHKRAKH